MGFSRHEYWCGLLFPAPGDLPDPGIGPVSPTLQADALPMNSSISPLIMLVFTNIFTNVFTNINKVLFVTLWNLFLSDLKKWKFEAYSLSGCPGTKKECFCIIAEASHFLGRGLFQLEESRDLHHHSASFSSYFLVQASSVSSFQIRRGIQVSSGFTSSSHAHCSRSGSWSLVWKCAGLRRPSNLLLGLCSSQKPAALLCACLILHSACENSPALLESENPLSPSGKRGTLLLLLQEV